MFQLKVADAILNGSGRVLLRAPTGSGKTRAALLAPLAAWRDGRPIADRVLYAVPLRSLATSLAREATSAIKQLGLPARVTLQIGGSDEDPLFDRGHIVFTTIDQLLSRYLALPYSLGQRRANMCPGALLGALIVLDEIHLLELERALGTSLVMLGRHLRGLCRFVLMSATLSQSALDILGRALGAVTLTVSPEEAAGWAGFANIKRTVHVREQPLEAESLLVDLEKADWPARVLVVVNTVGRAQELYAALRGAGNPRYELGLLHSRYLATDRRFKEECLLSRFGKNRSSDAPPSLLVATQVVEVGLDLSCDQLHTELAPASALVQRFGRCARWPGESGTVVIHPPHADARGNWRLGPYAGERQAVEATWDALRARDGAQMDAWAASVMVDEVHGRNDRRRFEQLNLDAVEGQVARAIDAAEMAMRRERIRDADSVAVLVLDESQLPDPRRVAEWVNIPRTSLYRLASSHAGAAVRIPDFEASTYGTWGQWRRAPLTSDLIRDAFIMLLPSGVAAYDGETGLRLGVPGELTAVRERIEGEPAHHGYQREEYLSHVERVLRAGRALESGSNEPSEEPGQSRPTTEVALALMDQELGRSGAATCLCRLACVLHDVGKLTTDWQQWAARWQEKVNPEVPRAVLAHTTFDPDRHSALESQFAREGWRRPAHAVASALACEMIVEFVVDRLLEGLPEVRRDNAVRAVLSAIARHHAPRATQARPFRFVEEADRLVRESLRIADLPVPEDLHSVVGSVTTPRDLERFQEDLAVRLSASDTGGLKAAREASILYWLVVRYLRSADGHSQVLARIEEV